MEPYQEKPLRPEERRRRSGGHVTLQDVAQAAGVSLISASRVVRGVRGVSPQLAARVREAVARLGYTPDPAARALASRRSTLVPVLVPMLSNTLFVDVIEAVHGVLFPAGYQPLIGVTHYDHEQEEQLLRGYLAMRPAGLLVTGFERSEAVRRLISTAGAPCVHLMEVCDAPDVYCVGFSQVEAGAALTRHLIDRGYRRIAWVAAQLDARTMQRAEGYRRALRDANLYDPGLELLCAQPSSVALGVRLLEQLLQLRPDVQAVFFNNDDLAQGALLSALRHGIEVPRRLAIAGFNDLPGSAEMVPPLTTVRTPRAEVGARAAQMLLDLMEGRKPSSACVRVRYEVVIRGST